MLKAGNVARSMGCPPGSPFQWEAGVAYLGWGVLGLMCPWYGRGFWLATIVMASIFLRGAAVAYEELHAGERGRPAVPHVQRTGLTPIRRFVVHCPS